MADQLLLSLLCMASAAAASPSSRSTAHSNSTHEPEDSHGSSSLHWGECDFAESLPVAVPIQCAGLDVPLDYTDSEAGTLNLSLSRVKAVNEPVLGSILFNFGGPGYEAVQSLAGLAPLLLKYEDLSQKHKFRAIRC